MRGLVTTALDVIGLFLVAAGLAALAFPAVGWSCLAVAGLVLLVGSALASRIGGS